MFQINMFFKLYNWLCSVPQCAVHHTRIQFIMDGDALAVRVVSSVPWLLWVGVRKEHSL